MRKRLIALCDEPRAMMPDEFASRMRSRSGRRWSSSRRSSRCEISSRREAFGAMGLHGLLSYLRAAHTSPNSRAPLTGHPIAGGVVDQLDLPGYTAHPIAGRVIDQLHLFGHTPPWVTFLRTSNKSRHSGEAGSFAMKHIEPLSKKPLEPTNRKSVIRARHGFALDRWNLNRRIR
jgi:hypothetical protein